MRKICALFFLLLFLFASACSSSVPTKCFIRVGDENVVQEMKIGKTNTVTALNEEDKKQYAHKVLLVSVVQDLCEFTVDDESLTVKKNTTEIRYDVKIKVIGVG